MVAELSPALPLNVVAGSRVGSSPTAVRIESYVSSRFSKPVDLGASINAAFALQCCTVFYSTRCLVRGIDSSRIAQTKQ